MSLELPRSDYTEGHPAPPPARLIVETGPVSVVGPTEARALLDNARMRRGFDPAFVRILEEIAGIAQEESDDSQEA